MDFSVGNDKILFKDEYSFAFLDIRPVFKGHVLLVPLNFYKNIFEIPPDVLSIISKNVKLLSTAVKNAIKCDGILIINNNIVSQSVDRFHIHIIPRNRGDGLRGFMWPRQKYQNDDEYNYYMNIIKIEIKNALKNP